MEPNQLEAAIEFVWDRQDDTKLDVGRVAKIYGVDPTTLHLALIQKIVEELKTKIEKKGG